jgi:predicted metal-dependent enzyme (double-stranded beta helix superfamily)
MDNQEITQLSKDLYRIFGKIRKLDPQALKDPAYTTVLKRVDALLREASINLEAIAQRQLRDNPDEFLDFLREIDEIKLLEVYN